MTLDADGNGGVNVPVEELVSERTSFEAVMRVAMVYRGVASNDVFFFNHSRVSNRSNCRIPIVLSEILNLHH